MDYRAMNALTDNVNRVCKSIAFSVSLEIEPIVSAYELEEKDLPVILSVISTGAGIMAQQGLREVMAHMGLIENTLEK